MLKSPIIVLGISLITNSPTSSAEALNIDMKPGLWEHSVVLDDNSAKQAQAAEMQKGMIEMKKQFANLPPEQRKMMEDMMAKQGIKVTGEGVSFENDAVKVSGDGTVIKQCITQLQIDNGELPEIDKNCKTDIVQKTKNHIKITYNCGGENPSTGVGEMIFDSPTLYTGTATFTNIIDGKPQTFTSKQSGKWLGTDCGTIKPRM